MDSKELIENIKDIFQTLSQLVVVIAPIAALIYYKFIKAYKKKISQLKLKDIEKSQQELTSFMHEKSMWSMKNLKEICNLYVDKSHADRVAYLQLENGTMADSQLRNMFLTCMAESDRYSDLPKWMNRIQRMPVQSIISYIEYVNQNGRVDTMSEDSKAIIEDEIKAVLYPDTISAWRMRVVRNVSGYIVGYVVFEYLFNNITKDPGYEFYEATSSVPIDECKAAIEAELLRYQNQIESKKNELKI